MAHQILPHNVWTKVFTDVTDQRWNFGYDSKPTSYLIHDVLTGGAVPTDTQDYEEVGLVGPMAPPSEPHANNGLDKPSFKQKGITLHTAISAHFKDVAGHDIYIKPLHADGKITY